MPSYLLQNECRLAQRQCLKQLKSPDITVVCQMAKALRPPEIDSSVASGSDCRRSDRQTGADTAAHKRTAMVVDPIPSKKLLDEKYQRPLEDHKLAIKHSLVLPNNVAGITTYFEWYLILLS